MSRISARGFAGINQSQADISRGRLDQTAWKPGLKGDAMRRRGFPRLGFLMIAAVTLCVSGLVFGQSGGSMSGSVKDASSAALTGAKVTVSDPARSVTQVAATNSDGVFVFPNLPPGNYTVIAEKAGFKRLEKQNVRLGTGDRISAGDFMMEVGQVVETVQVSADAGQLQIKTDSGERSDLISGEQLRNIGLNGRNVIDLAKVVPGVISGGAASGSGASTVTNITGSFTINGTRNTQHEYTVDGVTNYNLGNNTGALVSVNPDALEEVKILTSNYQAEYGRSGGGFIALTTRGGTNQYHGSARYFRRHDSLNANTYFNNARGGSDRGFARPLYRFNFYGWDFGGPVVTPRFGEGGPAIWNGKGKLFFFINQEYYNQLVPQLAAVNIRVPTTLERNGDFSQSVDGAGNRTYIKDPQPHRLSSPQLAISLKQDKGDGFPSHKQTSQGCRALLGPNLLNAKVM